MAVPGALELMSDLERARRLFQEAGLGFPTMPVDLAAELKEQDKWCFSTRKLGMSPYNLQHYVHEADQGAAYVVLAHSGHSINSYAIQYYLVYGPLRLFLHLGWGGVYMDTDVAAFRIRECFSLADEIVPVAIKSTKLSAGQPLTVVGSDFYGSYWSPPGRKETKRMREQTPSEVLTEVLRWLKTPLPKSHVQVSKGHHEQAKRLGSSSKSRQVERIPFANETQLQAVLEDEVETMFGADVVASARRGGGRLFDIDILAIDEANTPIIVECKWDRINQRAVEQLMHYRGVLKRSWRTFEQRVQVVRGQKARLKWRSPLLVAVGYRLDRPLTGVPTGMLFFTYSYHGVALGTEPVEIQVPGEVSFRSASVEGSPKDRHPKVSKKSAIHRRLEPFSDGVRAAFWEIDQALRNLGEVEVVYGGKNFVRYRGPRGRFAEAVVGDDSIEWYVGGARRSGDDVVRMFRASDKEGVMRQLRRAYEEAG